MSFIIQDFGGFGGGGKNGLVKGVKGWFDGFWMHRNNPYYQHKQFYYLKIR
jgi:hypothetical protein